jgi:hypothetical protein
MSSPIGQRLFRSSREDSDARSAFFALASLMMILLPTLLMVTNPQKMVAVPLSLSKPNGTFTPSHTGIVEKITIVAMASGFTVEMHVRKSDVLASKGNTEIKSWTVENWQGVQDRLVEIQKVDPEQGKISLRPSPTDDAQTVIGWLDSLQLSMGFESVVLEHPE